MPDSMIVVAGHVCLDIIPAFPRGASSLEAILQPGKLVETGPAALSNGGAVANTGQALQRLGLPVRLMGKVGADPFGTAVLDLFRRREESLAGGMIVDPGAGTSYTVVINPPGLDRVFLHFPGANDSFCANDVPARRLEGCGLFHFGYPPLMRAFYEDPGELAELLNRVRNAHGLTTSLDMALPDPDSPAGRADWPEILKRALPHTDLFAPSLDETVYMLDPGRGMEVRARGARGEPLGGLSAGDIRALADELIALGAAIVMLKLGDQGAYLRATADAGRLAALPGIAPGSPDAWPGAEWNAPCFEVEVAGTTGSGDCTVAGFLAAFAKGLGPEDCLRAAVAVGAAGVEQPDATSGVPDWTSLESRLSAGWRHAEPRATLPGRRIGGGPRGFAR